MIKFEKIKYAQMNSIVPLIQSVISEGREAKIRVTGNSMYPTLVDRRDVVRLSAIDGISVGDVLLYRRENGDYVMHRVIGKKGENLAFAGDNELVREYPVKKSQCIAKMTGFTRRGVDYDCRTDAKYRIIAFLWTRLFFMRRVLAKVFGVCIKIRRRIKK